MTKIATEIPKTLAEVEREYVLAILSLTNQNKTHAARILGISRRGLLNKLKKWQEQEAHDKLSTQ